MTIRQGMPHHSRMTILSTRERIIGELKEAVAEELDLDEAVLERGRIPAGEMTEEEIAHLREAPPVEELLHELVENDPLLHKEAEELTLELDDPEEAVHQVMERELWKIVEEIGREVEGRRGEEE
jgi:hypothetical protein